MNELLDALRNGYRFTATMTGFGILVSLSKDGFIIHRMIDSQVLAMSLVDVFKSEIAKMRKDFEREITLDAPATPPPPSTPAIEQPRPSDGHEPE